MVLGYDLNVRFAQALGLDLFDEVGNNTLCMSAVFGAAAAAGSLLGFDAQRMRYVLSYAAQQSGGIMTWKRDPDHIEKAFAFSGQAARDGVASAVMVEHGFTGVDDVLDGKTNFLGVFTRKGDPDALLRGLGTDFEIARTNIKKWCVGGPIQAPLDGLSRCSPTASSAKRSNVSTFAWRRAKPRRSTTARCPTSACSTNSASCSSTAA